MFHHAEQTERPYTQGEGHETVDNSKVAVEYQCEGATPEKTRSEKAGKAHVAEETGKEPDDEYETDSEYSDPEGASRHPVGPGVGCHAGCL